jgi:hypothetical protein
MRLKPLLIGLLLTPCLYASDVKVSGFATFAVGKQDRTDSGVVGYGDEISGSASNSNDIKFQPDSLVGLQFDTTINEKTRAAVQVINRFSDDNTMVTLEWAYMNYDFNDESSLQFGRYRPPIFLYSNTKDVGYTYLTIRPTSDLYGEVPISYVDGLNYNYTHEFDNEVELGMNLYGGNIDNTITVSGSMLDFQFDKLVGIELSAKNEYIKFRLGFVNAIVNADLEPLNSNGLIYNDIENLKVKNINAHFGSLGVSVDYENIIFVSELIGRHMDSSIFADNTNAFYATLGYRLKKYIPYASYATIYADSSNLDVHEITKSQDLDQSSYRLGFNYVVDTSSILKFEYLYRDKKHSGGGSEPIGKYNLFVAAWNLVF